MLALSVMLLLKNKVISMHKSYNEKPSLGKKLSLDWSESHATKYLKGTFNLFAFTSGSF